MNCENDISLILDDLSALNKALSFHWKTNTEILNLIRHNYWKFEENEYNDIYCKIKEIMRDIKIVKRGSDLVKAAALREQSISEKITDDCFNVFSNMDSLSMKWAEFYGTLNAVEAKV